MDNFMKEPFDMKRFVMLSVRKIWMLLLSIVFCSLLFGAFCYGKEVWLAGPDQYCNETLYHINFNQEQVGDIHDYYNDYTWNDVLDSDQIAGKAAEATGIPKEEIIAATEIPVMSDIRFFWVVVNSDSQKRAEQIGSAIEQAVIRFAENTEGFRSIEVYDRIDTYVVEKKAHLMRWFVFGAVVGGVVGLLYLLYENALDDSMYVESDIEKRFGILCLGVAAKSPKHTGEEYQELKTNLCRLMEGKKDIIFAEGYFNAGKDPVTQEELITQDYLEQLMDEIVKETGMEKVIIKKVSYEKGKEREYFMKLREADSVVWMLPFGRNDGTKLDRAWKNLHFWSCKVDAAMLIGVSMNYYRSYYAGKRKTGKA